MRGTRQGPVLQYLWVFHHFWSVRRRLKKKHSGKSGARKSKELRLKLVWPKHTNILFIFSFLFFMYTFFTPFRVIPRIEVFSFCASRTSIYAVAGQRMQVTFHWRHAYFLEMLAFQVNFCYFIIYNNKSQLLLHPNIYHLIW